MNRDGKMTKMEADERSWICLSETAEHDLNVTTSPYILSPPMSRRECYSQAIGTVQQIPTAWLSPTKRASGAIAHLGKSDWLLSWMSQTPMYWAWKRCVIVGRHANPFPSTNIIDDLVGELTANTEISVIAVDLTPKIPYAEKTPLLWDKSAQDQGNPSDGYETGHWVCGSSISILTWRWWKSTSKVQKAWIMQKNCKEACMTEHPSSNLVWHKLCRNHVPIIRMELR
jgi:hypothetical protein